MIKIQRAHISKSYLKFRHVPELSHSMHQGIIPPQKHPPPYFLPSPLQIVQAPLFRQFPIVIYCFFVPPPLPRPKNWWTPIILTFFIFNPILSLKTKYLVKIFQLKFLVMVHKHFGLQFFCRLEFQILVCFLCTNCDPSLPLLKKVTPSFPETFL